MVVSLLPASAAAYATRTAPTIALTTVESWLTTTLRRIRRIKRPSNNVSQHVRVLSEVLGGPDAIWSLCAVMVPRAPDSMLPKNPQDPLMEAFNYRLIHISAYVVSVDMVSRNEVAFKLTSETISALVEYHRDIYLVDAAASTCNWPGKAEQIHRLHQEFTHAVNRHVFRTDKQALEGLEEHGLGELLGGRSIAARDSILNLFMPLNPPPPPSEVFDIMVQANVISSQSPGAQSSWVPVVPSQGLASQPSNRGSDISIVPSQQVTQCNQQSIEAHLPDLSDFCADLDFSTMKFPMLSQGQEFATSQELASPLSTSSLSSPDGSVNFDQTTGLYLQAMTGSISPQSAGFSDFSTPMLTPCSQDIQPMTGLDLSLLLSEGWPGASDSFMCQYGATA